MVFFGKKAQRRNFLEWCHGEGAGLEGAQPHDLRASEVGHVPTRTENWGEDFIRYVEQHIKSAQTPTTFSIKFDRSFPAGNYLLHGVGTEKGKVISSLILASSVGDLTIEGADIYTAEVMGRVDLDISATFRNCRIRRLAFASRGQSNKSKLCLIDTFVETLEAQPSSVRELEIRGGATFNWVLPPPDDANPFSGNVALRSVYFPRCRRDGLKSGVQGYANLRHHLKKLENAQMANLAYTLELAAEREGDTLTNRGLSWGYEMLSDFGRSALRPFLWVALLFCITWLAAFSTHGAVLAHERGGNAYSGWRSTLVREGYKGDLSRSFVLAVQAIVNPLSVFGPRSLVVPRSGLLATWVVIQSILSILLIALLILSVRRRFRVQ